MTTFGDLKRAEAVANKGSPLFWRIRGWEVGLSFGPRRDGLEVTPGPARSSLSAVLFPRGRSSSRHDWDYLGEVMETIGAPMDGLMTPFETTHPNATHYWMWREIDKKEATA